MHENLNWSRRGRIFVHILSKCDPSEVENTSDGVISTNIWPLQGKWYLMRLPSLKCMCLCVGISSRSGVSVCNKLLLPCFKLLTTSTNNSLMTASSGRFPKVEKIIFCQKFFLKQTWCNFYLFLDESFVKIRTAYRINLYIRIGFF